MSYILTRGFPVSSLRKSLQDVFVSELDSDEERHQALAVIDNEAVSSDKEVPGEAVLSPPSTPHENIYSSPSTPILNI